MFKKVCLSQRTWCTTADAITFRWHHRNLSISSLLNPKSNDTPAEDQLLTVQGLVRSVRKQKKVAFLALGDGTTYLPLQAVLSPEQTQGVSTGSAVSLTGYWKPSPSSQQSHELHVTKVDVSEGHDAESFPLQKKYHSTDFLRTIPHLRARTPFNSLLLRLRSQAISSSTRFFEDEEFVQSHTPLITSSDCEGAGEAFTVGTQSSSTSDPAHPNFFRDPKYLTVSAQLHLEAIAAAVGKAWTLSPTFRAEQSDTPRHLSEFYMLEAEVSYEENADKIMDVVERLLQFITTRLSRSQVGEDLLQAAHDPKHAPTDSAVTKETLQNRWTQLIDGKWPRITYVDAVAHLQDAIVHGRASFEHPTSFGHGLQAEHERYLAQTLGNNGPVFITDYPRAIKAFYMAATPSQPADTPSDRRTVSCFDLLVPDLCEIVGGSIREHRKDALLQSMLDHGVIKNDPPDRGYESLPPNFSLAANMVAGAFAGIAEHSVMYPIDLLKTRMQVVNPSPTAVYSGISNAMVTITKVEGFRTLWRGVSSVVVGAGPAHAVYFATYESVKHAMGGNEGGKHEHHPLAAAVSGSCATIASDALMNPFDVIKQRMQIQNSSYKSIVDCARTVFRNEGLTAFYVSYPTTLCMTVPFTALQFVAYESMSKVLNPKGQYDPYTHCFAGGLAGGIAAGITTPLDVIKTLLQTRGSANDAELRTVQGLAQAARIIKQREGYKGFFRGLKPRIVTTMPSTAICWTAYEMAKAFFIARNER
ncbi:mitochondrial carrier [Microthyrium microscopicum]|uniref:asparagine--tRNA ligase n=1 Tax=Microthyrium microscopicum TaxID=703497 RepID=A0A6A6U5K7_9PEZI|nr:mitochondrial carrier [Microthyrium microscopicum]